MDPTPARWPYAEINVESKMYPALVIEWAKLPTDNAGPTWHAHCLWWDGQPSEGMIPTNRVTRVGD